MLIWAQDKFSAFQDYFLGFTVFSKRKGTIIKEAVKPHHTIQSHTVDDLAWRDEHIGLTGAQMYEPTVTCEHTAIKGEISFITP